MIDIKIAVVIPPPLKFSGQAIEKGKWFPIKKYQNRKKSKCKDKGRIQNIRQRKEQKQKHQETYQA